MKIDVTPKATEWFEKEVGLSSGSAVRFSGKVYGKTEVHEGFSIGLEVTQPENTLAEKVINGVTYYIEKNDEWFFSGYDLKIDFDEKNEEPQYKFIEH